LTFIPLSLPLIRLEGSDSQRTNALAGRNMRNTGEFQDRRGMPLEFQSHSFPGDLAHVKATFGGFPSECVLGIIWKSYAQPIIQLNPRRFRFLNLLNHQVASSSPLDVVVSLACQDRRSQRGRSASDFLKDGKPKFDQNSHDSISCYTIFLGEFTDPLGEAPFETDS